MKRSSGHGLSQQLSHQTKRKISGDRLRIAAPIAFLLIWAQCISAELRIVDHGGNPVPGARVIIKTPLESTDPLAGMEPALVAETGSHGTIGVALPTLAPLLIMVDHPEHAPLVLEVARAPAATLRLSPGQVWVDRVKFDGETLQGGQICVAWKTDVEKWSASYGWLRCSDLGADGSFLLRGLQAKKASITIRSPGYVSTEKHAVPSAKLSLYLAKGILVRGSVLEAQGKRPVAGASVRTPSGGRSYTTETGTFAIAVESLPIELTVEANGFKAKRARVARERKDSLRIRLRKGTQLRGEIVDGAGEPLPGALAWIRQQSTDGSTRSQRHSIRTEEGRFSIDLSTFGDIAIRLKADGLRQEAPLFVTVDEGQSLDIGVVQLGSGAALTGRLHDPKTDKPISGADIRLLPVGTALLTQLRHHESPRAVSKVDGSFKVSGLAAGQYELRIRFRRRATKSIQIYLEKGETQELGSIPLEKGTRIRGSLVDRRKLPRPGLTIRFFDAERQTLLPMAERRSDADGRFAGPSLAAGSYRVEVSGQRLLLSQGLKVSGELEVQTLALQVGGTHLVGLVTRHGIPVAGGFLMVTSALDSSNNRGKILLRRSVGDDPGGYGLPDSALSTDVDQQGYFELLDAPPGRLLARYLGPEGQEVTRWIDVADTARAQINLELGGVDLEGRVAESGLGIGVEAKVTLLYPSGRIVRRFGTDSTGYFLFDDLAPGVYSVEASAPGFSKQVVRGVKIDAKVSPLALLLERGESGAIEVWLRRWDGVPAGWTPLTLYGGAGQFVAALPTNDRGRRVFRDLPAGSYNLAWADSWAGAGASGPIMVRKGDTAVKELWLSEGAPITVACTRACANEAVGAISLVSSQGIDLAPSLSGLRTALRFSPDGTLQLGRLSEGNYLLRIQFGGQIFERGFHTQSAATTVLVDPPG